MYRTRTAWLMLAPLFLGVIVFFAAPLAILVRYTFTSGAGGREYVGLATYRDVFSSGAFRLAASNTARFVVIGVLLNMAGSFFLSLAIRRRFVGSRAFRSVIILPLFLSVAAIVTAVMALFGDGGLVNRALGAMGMPTVKWFSSDAAFPLMLGLYVFKSFGYSVVLMLSGLSAIPPELYETADVDGAGAVWKTVHITLPLLSPTLFFVFLIAAMNCFRSFRDVFLLGGNHPHDSVYMLPHFINNNIQNLNYHRLAVASVMTLFVILASTAIIYRLESGMERRL
jgi:multiple sugar transport system permease protein